LIGEAANAVMNGTAWHPGPALPGPGAADAQGKPISAYHSFLRSIAMPYRSYTPASPLGDFVDSFWHYDGYSPSHRKERILPSGTVELVINHRETYDHLASVYDRRWADDTEATLQATLGGLELRPGGPSPTT
jgi:hypothetical protein